MTTITKGTIFSPKKTLNISGNAVFTGYPLIMGILNITPDSFYDGGMYNSVDASLKRAEKLIQEGADMLDIGGYSSRPGAKEIGEQEEMDRVLPVIQAIHSDFSNAVLSVDTFRAGVAKEAVKAGASIVNDISAGNADPAMIKTVARLGTPYIMMHMRGTPQTMQDHTAYDHLINDMVDELMQQVHKAKEAGIKDIIVDPGIGFSKTVAQNFQIVKNLRYFQALGYPVLAGMSRKSFIYKTLNCTPEEALNGTTSMNAIALMNGASILRVHDVREAVECVKLYKSVTG